MALLFLGPAAGPSNVTGHRAGIMSQDLKQKMDPQAHLKSKGQSLGDNVEEF